MEETHVQTVCVLSRARPCGRGLLPPSRCPALQTAPWPRHTHGRCAAKPARPGGEGPCSLPLAARLSRVRHGRDTCTGGARPGPGETWQGGTLLPPSRCSAQPTAPRPRHTRGRCAARAGRDPAGRGPAPSLSLLGTADSPMAATHAQGGARLQPGETRRGRALLSSLSLSAEPTASRPRRTHRRCAARAGRDQAGEGSALSLLLLGISLLC